MGPSRMRRLALVLALTATTALPGCMTMALWGFEEEPGHGDDDGGYRAVRGTKWEWWRVLLRIAATPVTLAGDVGFGLGVSAIFGSEDCEPVWLRLAAGDDDDRCARGHRRSRASSRRRSIGTSLVDGVRR